MKTRKAIVMVSGGLDSILAAKIVAQQDVEIIPIRFTSPFYPSDNLDIVGGIVPEIFGVPVRLIPKGNEYFEVVKNPQYGYGSALNPCIDCRIYMFRKARMIMEEESASFIVTGEVINQRPFSQKRFMLELIERKSQLCGRVLRPLSAKLLPPTEPELSGCIDREKLFGISGRGRKMQIELARTFGLSGFSQPAGGCLLTDKTYAARLKELIQKILYCSIGDAELIKHGRIFWNERNLVVLGRDRVENDFLERVARCGDRIVKLENAPSPLALIRGEKITGEVVHYCQRLILQFTKKKIPGVPVFSIKCINL